MRTHCNTKPTRAAFGATFVFAAVAACGAGNAHAATYVVEPGGDNLVKFESKAPMESFDGKTNAASGRITLEPSALADTIAIEISVDLATLDTGIKLRNQHMRENHLHTDEFPKGVFSGGKIVEGAGASLEGGAPCTIELEGALTLHGVTKVVRVPATIRLAPGAAGSDGGPGRPRLHFDASFDVALADYEIPRPQMLFMKLGEKQRVVVELVGVEETAK